MRASSRLGDTVRTASALALLATAMVATPAAAVPTTFDVNDPNDAGTGGCTVGECTLREAIVAANANAGADTITFTTLGAGTVIRPTTALDAITEAVTINGTTAAGYPGSPIIEVSGEAAPAGTNGLTIRASNVTISGLAITRFPGNGIQLRDTTGGSTTASITINKNYIGVGVDGTTPLGNGESGIDITDGSAGNAIGTSTIGISNVISANGGSAISIHGGVSTGYGHAILGNYIGTDVSGLVDLGNGGGIILFYSHGMTISGNVISGNGSAGVDMSFSLGMTPNEIYGNLIGVGADGTTAIGNGGRGVQLFQSGFTFLGGRDPGEPNVIANNGNDGIALLSDDVDGFVQNSIYSNGGLGIDLVDGTGQGVTPNDPGDADPGPGQLNSNHLQNYPVITSVALDAANTTVTGTLNSVPGHPYVIDLFASPECDPSGHGEGQTFLGYQVVTTDGNGDASFTATLPAVPLGHVITALATDDALAETSEFSACARAGRLLRVNKAGSGSGTVTGSPGTINCGADCEELYLDGASVTLTAVPAPGSALQGWSDPGCPGTGACTVTMDADKAVTATFEVPGTPLQPKSVTLKARPKRVEAGEKTRLKAAVLPCAGHENDSVEFYRGARLIGTKVSDGACIARMKARVRNPSTFTAVSPQQDADHPAGTSNGVRVKVK